MRPIGRRLMVSRLAILGIPLPSLFVSLAARAQDPLTVIQTVQGAFSLMRSATVQPNVTGTMLESMIQLQGQTIRQLAGIQLSLRDMAIQQKKNHAELLMAIGSQPFEARSASLTSHVEQYQRLLARSPSPERTAAFKELSASVTGLRGDLSALPGGKGPAGAVLSPVMTTLEYTCALHAERDRDWLKNILANQLAWAAAMLAPSTEGGLFVFLRSAKRTHDDLVDETQLTKSGRLLGVRPDRVVVGCVGRDEAGPLGRKKRIDRLSLAVRLREQPSQGVLMLKAQWDDKFLSWVGGSKHPEEWKDWDVDRSRCDIDIWGYHDIPSALAELKASQFWQELVADADRYVSIINQVTAQRLVIRFGADAIEIATELQRQLEVRAMRLESMS